MFMFNRFQIYKDRVGGFRWRLLARNNEIVAVSEAYTTKYSAERSAKRVKAIANSAVINYS